MVIRELNWTKTLENKTTFGVIFTRFQKSNFSFVPIIKLKLIYYEENIILPIVTCFGISSDGTRI
jgi:hypothetical protein